MREYVPFPRASHILLKYILVYSSSVQFITFYIFITASHIRLISSNGEPNVSSGNIQILLNNQWWTLCYSPTITDIGAVVCKQLGFAYLEDLTTDYNNM